VQNYGVLHMKTGFPQHARSKIQNPNPAFPSRSSAACQRAAVKKGSYRHV